MKLAYAVAFKVATYGSCWDQSVAMIETPGSTFRSNNLLVVSSKAATKFELVHVHVILY
jgi:hypothetical protein